MKAYDDLVAELARLDTLEFDIRLERARLLALAWIEGGRTQADIAEEVGLSAPGVSNLVAWADMVTEARRHAGDPELRFSQDVHGRLRGWEWVDALQVLQDASTTAGRSWVRWGDVLEVLRNDPILRRRYWSRRKR